MKRFARICTILMVLVMVFSLCTTAYAAGSVTYDGSANKFIFQPGSAESPSNLFEDFRNIMPGDKLTEQIVIKNKTSNGYKIRVYLRSLGAQESTDAFLSQMKLTVVQKDDSILFSAPADETAQLKDWVYLGTVYSGGEITLDVILEAPITMSDAYQNQTGYVDWEFKVDKIPIEPSDPQPPQTGDSSNIFFYTGLMIISLMALIILLWAGKRKKQES